MTQPSPAKPTWAQILNSNPNASSNNNTSSSATITTTGNTNNINVAGTNSQSSSSSPSSQHSATNKNVSPSASGAFNIIGSSRTGFMPNFYDQQQSQMNWPLNFNQTSSWMIDDETQRQGTNSSQQSMDNNHNTQTTSGDGMSFVLLFML